MNEHLWVKVGRVKSSGIVSPLGNIGVVVWGKDWLIVLLFPHLELLGHWSISCLLEELNLISAEAGVIKDLPLLWLTFVSIHLTLDHLSLTDDLLDPVLELDEHFFHSWGVLESGDSSVLPRELLLVVVIVVIMLTWTIVVPHFLHVCLLGVPDTPELVSHLLTTEIVEVLLK